MRYGYRRLHVLHGCKVRPINQKRTVRICGELGLQLRKKMSKRRVQAKLREVRRAARHPNKTCAMDVVHDQLAAGLTLRVLPNSRHLFALLAGVEPRSSFRGVDVVEILGSPGKWESRGQFVSIRASGLCRRTALVGLPAGRHPPITLLYHDGTASPPP